MVKLELMVKNYFSQPIAAVSIKTQLDAAPNTMAGTAAPNTMAGTAAPNTMAGTATGGAGRDVR